MIGIELEFIFNLCFPLLRYPRKHVCLGNRRVVWSDRENTGPTLSAVLFSQLNVREPVWEKDILECFLGLPCGSAEKELCTRKSFSGETLWALVRNPAQLFRVSSLQFHSWLSYWKTLHKALSPISLSIEWRFITLLPHSALM